MNPKLEAIAETAAHDLKALVREKETEILEAWNAAEEEAQAQESKPKFRLSLAITLDIEADKMETALTFSIKRTAFVERSIPDPDQKDLALNDQLDGTTVTISGAGIEPMEMSGKEFKSLGKAASKLNAKITKPKTQKV